MVDVIVAPFRLDGLQIPPAMTFMVLWGQGKRLNRAQVPIAEQVTAHLQEACKRTIEQISAKEFRTYSPDMHLEQEECIVITDESLIKSSPMGAALFSDEPLQLVNAHDLDKHKISLYALLISSTIGQVGFARRTDPRVTARVRATF